jgi:hypothetical protein
MLFFVVIRQIGTKRYGFHTGKSSLRKVHPVQPNATVSCHLLRRCRPARWRSRDATKLWPLKNHGTRPDPESRVVILLPYANKQSHYSVPFRHQHYCTGTCARLPVRDREPNWQPAPVF